MIASLLILFSSLLLSTGLVLSRTFFFRLAIHTMAMLNTIIDTDADDAIKQKLLIRNLSNLLLSLFLFSFVIAGILFLSLLPLLAYVRFDWQALANLEWQSLLSYIALLIGSTVPFVLFSLKKEKQDYTEWSMLLHRMILDHSNISKQLFGLEKKLFSSKLKQPASPFVIVSGLARSGTSALTTLLYDSGIFHSLSYANMPFLLSPNSWKKVYNPCNENLRERAHGDKVMFGYTTIEALEEYFFKAHLNNNFIHDNTLHEHTLDEKTYRNYIQYQQLLKGKNDTTYLAKNNNFILRYRSLREWNKDFKVIFIFRNPIEHAYSLFKQHQRFKQLHAEDSFSLEYMNWLGHHEFGVNLKHFQFATSNIPTDANPDTIDYWLHTWINYYTELLNLPNDPKRMLLQYEDFLHEPRKTMHALSDFLGMEIPIHQLESFKNENSYTGELEPLLKQQCLDLYAKLIVRKASI